MRAPHATCLIAGDCDALVAPLVDAGWRITRDSGVAHAVVVLACPAPALPRRRPVSAAPLLLVPTGGATSDERAAAFAAGADDVAPDGCGHAELVARLEALCRRPGGSAAPIRCGDLAIDPLHRRATRGGNALPLLPREYALLHHLAGEAGRAVSRMDLLRAVWRLPFDPCTNVVEVHVSRLRAKLDRGFASPLLHTVRGRGYALAETPPLD